jgi:hypothetical protein
MRALETALIYLVPFVAIGLIAKLVIPRWMARHGADLSEIPGRPNRWRRVFPVGMWRGEE